MASRKGSNTPPETPARKRSTSHATTAPGPRNGRAKPVPASEPIAAMQAAPASPTKAVPAAAAPMPVVDGQARQAMIAEAAYYRAQKRGDGPGDPVSDWYEAEAEIEHLLEGSTTH